MKQETLTRMSDRRARLDAWFATHLGVVTLAALISFGYSKSAIYRMIERGELIPLLPGVYKGSQWPTGRDQLMAAICLRNPGAVIGSLTAAEIWKFRRSQKDSLIHVLVPHGTSACFDGIADKVIVHRCRRIDPVDIVRRDDGLRVVSPTRALFDVADIVRDAAATSILEQLVNSGMGTLTTHISTMARLAHSRRSGTATMARVIAGRPTWNTAMQSDLETRVFAEVARQGLPIPEIQYALLLPDGKTIRLDFAWPQFRIALEVDHPFWHAGTEASHKDKRRDRKATTIGWLTIRVTDMDVNGGLTEAITDVATTIELATQRA